MTSWLGSSSARKAQCLGELPLAPDEFDDAAKSHLNYVARRGAIILSLWVVEIENALRNAYRRKRVNEDEAYSILIWSKAKRVGFFSVKF